jgi:ADP-ribose pyrophosphatase YjhB (NUDIX family)
VQYGALPYRFTADAAREIHLVTTRQTRRWIIPKGWPIKGLRPAKSAAREAFEEAGVRGKIAQSRSVSSPVKSLDEAVSHDQWFRWHAGEPHHGRRQLTCSMTLVVTAAIAFGEDGGDWI